MEVAHPFQLPHFTGNNSQHLCNALGQDQRCRSSRVQWGLPEGWSLKPAWWGWWELDAEATEDCCQTECRPCVSRSSRFSREAGNLDFFFFKWEIYFFFPQMLALNDIIYCKTLRGPNKTHLWAFQSIWASRFYICGVYATILHTFLWYFPARTVRSRELGSCPSLYYKWEGGTGTRVKSPGIHSGTPLT